MMGGGALSPNNIYNRADLLQFSTHLENQCRPLMQLLNHWAILPKSNNLYISLCQNHTGMGRIPTPQHKKIVMVTIAIALSAVLLTSAIASSSVEQVNAFSKDKVKEKVKEKVNNALKKIKDRLGGSNGGGGCGGCF